MPEQGAGRAERHRGGRERSGLMILLIDNYDSFVYNLYQLIGSIEPDMKVVRNDKITVKDLLYGLMLVSGNDAAIALAEHVGGDIQGFADLMNNKANELGLTNTHYESPHGLDSDGHYTTAYELAKLADYALKNETFSNIVGTKNYTVTINGYPKNLSNTNELLGKKVHLQKDISQTDDYNRLLRYVWLEKIDTINEENIENYLFNAKLVINGYAQSNYYKPDISLQDYLEKFENEAKQQKIGIWQ